MRKRKSLKNLIIGFMCILMAYSLVNQQLTMRRLKTQYKDTYEELQERLKENEILSAEVEASTSNPLYMERLARERLGLILPGETIIIDDPSISDDN